MDGETHVLVIDLQQLRYSSRPRGTDVHEVLHPEIRSFLAFYSGTVIRNYCSFHMRVNNKAEMEALLVYMYVLVAAR